MWWLYFRHDGKLVGVAIIERAESLFHARMLAVAHGIGRAADYSEGKEVDAEHAALVPRDHVGRMLSPPEAQRLIEQMASRRSTIQARDASRRSWGRGNEQGRVGERSGES
jgi:hypothetical protein